MHNTGTIPWASGRVMPAAVVVVAALFFLSPSFPLAFSFSRSPLARLGPPVASRSPSPAKDFVAFLTRLGQTRASQIIIRASVDGERNGGWRLDGSMDFGSSSTGGS